MEIKIPCVGFQHKDVKADISKWDLENAKIVNNFHRTFPEYQTTPLHSLKKLAQMKGIKNIFVKDESYRFGLNAFKVLGGSYAMGKYIADRLHKDISDMGYEALISKEVKEKLGNITFVTATDGNHGRGVAWTANRLQQKCVVYMPRGSAQDRLENILAVGGEGKIIDMSYDDAVRKAADDARKNGWVLLQDTSWEGYETVPTWIMQGYMSMAYETDWQIKEYKEDIPTHIFLQAGVGAMSAGITAFFSNLYRDCEKRPQIVIVEPENAACIFKTAQANDGLLHSVKGEMNTIMAGLACGEPCTVAWNILRDYADYVVTIPDCVAAKGMRVLANPVGDDNKIVSGESGAATFGFLMEILENPQCRDVKEKIGLDENSTVLCFSTEGNTDKENYQQIIWDGAYPSV